MTATGRVALGLLCFYVLLLVACMAGRANAASAPVTIPLPAAPSNGWCYRGPAPSAAQDVTVTLGDCPTPPPSACPAGRQTTAQVCYRYGPADCVNTDVTKFENLWGRLASTDTTIDLFPGNQVFAIVKNFQKSQYIATKFVAPFNPANLSGVLYTTETTSGPNTDYSISASCGDFNPPSSYCKRSNVRAGGAAGSWKLPGYAGIAFCPLVPGQTYYLNVKINNPAVTHFDCAGSACRVGIQNNHTP